MARSNRNRNKYNPADKSKNPELFAEQWIKSAEHDLVAADILLSTGHYGWSSFACQQAIEKLLKAGYVRTRKKIPPHVHKLERLVAIMKLDPPEEHVNNLLEIDQCYTSTRYPGYRDESCALGREEAEEILGKTQETFKWIRKELQL